MAKHNDNIEKSLPISNAEAGQQNIEKADCDLSHEDALTTIRKLQAHTQKLESQISDLQDALVESSDLNAIYGSIFKLSPVPIAYATPTGEFFYNHACEQHLLLSEEDGFKQGMSFFKAQPTWQDYGMDGEPIPIGDMPFAQALQGNTTIGQEFRTVRKDGTAKWEVVNAAPIYDEQGNLIAGFITFPDITKLKEAEHRLLASERESRAWIECSPVCTKKLDLDLKLQYMSPSGVAALGVEDISAYYGKPYPLEFYPEAFKSEMLSVLEHTLKTEKTTTLESSMNDMDGNEIFFHSTIIPVFNGNNELDYLVIISIDTTDHNLAKRELQKNRLELDAFFDASPAGLAIINDQLQYTKINTTLAAINGSTVAEHIGKTSQELMPDIAPTIEPMFRKVLKEGASYLNVEINGETPAHPNIPRQWAVSYFPLSSMSGDSKSLGVVVIETTDRMRAEEELVSKNFALRDVNAQLKVNATTDKLTGLPNRAVFYDRLDQIMKKERDQERFAVLFFDYDRFKVVNDSLGHDVGDSLLCSIADIFRKELRETDTVARFGGDEFVVILGNLSEWDDAIRKAEELLIAFEVPHQLGDHLVVSTASIGIVTSKREYQYPSEMIRDADAAMYQAKASGKNQVVTFDTIMHADALNRLGLENDLRSAVTDEQLLLYYQPITDLASGELTGFEALVRWRHPQRGLVSPNDFIHIAEDTGLIVEIGQWVINTAAAQIVDWNKKYGANQALTMNVNVSKRQLLNASFYDNMIACKQEHGFQSGELKLEITESTAACAHTDVIPLLHQLRKNGFPIVMDDFGTGVSSLSTLHEMPIDVLKIDQAFVRMLDRDRSLLAVIESITSLADNLGIETVAEGIETSEIVAALQSINCMWGQGYYFAQPMNPSNAEQYINNHYQAKLKSA